MTPPWLVETNPSLRSVTKAVLRPTPGARSVKRQSDSARLSLPDCPRCAVRARDLALEVVDEFWTRHVPPDPLTARRWIARPDQRRGRRSSGASAPVHPIVSFGDVSSSRRTLRCSAGGNYCVRTRTFRRHVRPGWHG